VAVKIQVEVLWVVTPFGVVVGHQPSEELSASIFRVKMDAAWSSERWYPTAILHGVTIQKTLTCISTAVKTSNLASVNTLFVDDTSCNNC